MKENNIALYARLLCAFLFIAITLDLIVADISLIAGAQVGSWMFPLSVAMSAFLILKSTNARRTASLVILTGLLMMFATIIVSAVIVDGSYDGNTYHQSAVARLCDGWNPYRLSQLQTKAETLASIQWENCYARGIETIAATITSLTGKIESGKAVNFIAVFAMMSGIFAFLTAKGYKAKTAIYITILISGCPIVILQLVTYYIDFYKYVYLVISVLAVYWIYASRRLLDWMILACVIFMAISTKFNLAFEEGLFVIFALGWFLYKKEYKFAKSLFIIAAVIALISVALNYSPYITNTVAYGHPLYPLMGEGKRDIMTQFIPGFSVGNRFGDFVMTMIEVRPCIVYESIHGGSGFFMLPILLFAVFAFIYRIKTIPIILRYTAVITLGSCFLFPETWWPRYIPQVWLFPSIVLLACWKTKIGKTLGVLMLLNVMYCGANVCHFAIKQYQYRHLIYNLAKEQPVQLFRGQPSHMRHLAEENIDYQPIDSLPSDAPSAIFFPLRDAGPLEPRIIFSPQLQNQLTQIKKRFHME